jgi:hypothetical protein
MSIVKPVRFMDNGERIFVKKIKRERTFKEKAI